MNNLLYLQDEKTIFIFIMKRVILCFISLFLFHFSLAQNWLWGKMGIGDASVFSAASDENGNCFISGFFYPSDTLQFGSNLLLTLQNSMITMKYF
jgi:hypothetical protein